MNTNHCIKHWKIMDLKAIKGRIEKYFRTDLDELKVLFIFLFFLR